MTRTALLFAVLATALASMLTAIPAQAQRVFVAATGSDGNPCTFASPCRTFQHAHDTVTANGEIDVLDPAGFGPLTINKAISIQGHGFSGISVASGATGITVNAGPSDKVNLSGLILDGGATTNSIAIQFNSGQSLTVENCTVRNFGAGGAGLFFVNNTANPTTLAVSDSYFLDNAYAGIYVGPSSSGAVTAAIDRVVISGGTSNGLVATGNNGTGAVSVAVTDSVAANNASIGFAVFALQNHSVSTLVLTRSTASGNNTGIASIGDGIANAPNLWVGQSTVTQNSTGYSANGGIINSYGDNYIDVNGSNFGSLSGATKH
jgi:hypothetical protein